MRIAVVIISIFISGLLYGQGAEIASSDGKFVLKFPAGFDNPSFSVKDITTAAGKLKLGQYVSKHPDGRVFIISYNDYPKEYLMKAHIPELMDTIRESSLRSMQATLERQMDFTFEGGPARTVSFTLKINGVTGYGRLDYYLVSERLYQVIYIGLRKEDRDSKELKSSFKSFQLLHDDD
jgi:hypothetical protein